MCALKSLFIVNNLSKNFFLKTKVKYGNCFKNVIGSAIYAWQSSCVSDLLLGVEYYGLGVGNPDNVMVAVGSEWEPHSGR